MNAAIVVVAAAVFYRSGHFEVAAIEDAYKLLSPLVGAAGASTVFAIALLATGQNSSITGTLAGQVVMEGFIHIKLSPWLRRLITRSLAIVPTIIVVAFTGERGTEKLLLLSQVILSLQLSFAVVPLVIFTGSRKKMGEFVQRPMAAGALLVRRRADRWTERVVPGVDAEVNRGKRDEGRGSRESCPDAIGGISRFSTQHPESTFRSTNTLSS